MAECDVAVLGAGPAGMSAARAAADCGARVTVLDEYARPGGQYFKRAAPDFALEASQLSREHARGEAKRAALDHPGVTLLSGVLVWGLFDDDTVAFLQDGQPRVLRARAIVLATGAYDRPVPFPGWTLPGVMTAGGAQTIAKTQWVKPGNRVLLTGAGPFLLPVAQQLVRAGCDIVAILEATRRREWFTLAPALWGQWPRLAEARDYFRTLRGAGVPIRYGRKIVAAEGNGRVEAATIAKVDAAWRTVPGSEETITVDAVAVGYGFLPSIEVAASIGCDLRWDKEGLAWFVVSGPDMATSRKGVYAAGEITGIAGAAPAIEEGIIAGIGAASQAVSIDGTGAAERLRQALARRRRLDRFARAINTLFGPRPGLWEGVDGSTMVCRCEEVTAGEIQAAVADGCTTAKAIKDMTRAGMGLCQGRSCRAIVSVLIAQETGSDPGAIRFPHIRPPIKPVPAGALAAMELSGDAEPAEEMDA